MNGSLNGGEFSDTEPEDEVPEQQESVFYTIISSLIFCSIQNEGGGLDDELNVARMKCFAVLVLSLLKLKNDFVW